MRRTKDISGFEERIIVGKGISILERQWKCFKFLFVCRERDVKDALDWTNHNRVMMISGPSESSSSSYVAGGGNDA